MTYPFGLDVSSYQKSMDWQRAIDTGARFAFVKATEGSSYVDPQFAANWSELRRLGLPHGAYHFYRAAQGISQIEQFVDVVQPAPDELLVLDVESTGGLDKFQLTLNVKDAVEYIRQATGSYPILYSRASWLNANLIVSHLPKLDYWLAQYLKPYPWPFFTGMFPTEKMDIPAGVSREQVKFHQGTDKGNGVRRGAQSLYIDMNHFIGTEDGLAAYFGAAIIPEEHEVYLPIVITPPAPPASGNLAVTPYSQNDPRWRNVRLGTSGVTIGQQGCLITCVAMTLKFYGYDYTPATLNTYLTTHNGYANGNLLWWNRAPHLQIATWVDCLKIPTPLDKIDACLSRGEPAIVWVDFYPGTSIIDQHWVLIIGKLGADDYTMIDPWDGWQGSFKSRYVSPERYIYRIVSYKRGDK